MAYEVKLEEKAAQELDDALAWYHDKSESLAQDFYDDYLAVEDRLRVAPEQFPVAVENIRRANLSKFPYSIFFVIERISVFVLSVFHQKRNPKERF